MSTPCELANSCALLGVSLLLVSQFRLIQHNRPKAAERVKHILTIFGYINMIFQRDASEKELMAIVKDPLLVVWEAMNLLTETGIYPDTPYIDKLLADAEGVLCQLTIELARHAELRHPCQRPKIVLH
jgi:hypothetical protein